jgi:hypothetical protein
MDTNDNSRLTQERHLATTEERTVLALEMIADHLETISRAFVHIDDVREGDATFEGIAATGGDRGVADGWDGENEFVGPESRKARAIKRTLVEHFSVGGYDYTNLAHAIAEAKRDRRNGEHR